jgi:hypothetical protein
MALGVPRRRGAAPEEAPNGAPDLPGDRPVAARWRRALGAEVVACKRALRANAYLVVGALAVLLTAAALWQWRADLWPCKLNAAWPQTYLDPDWATDNSDFLQRWSQTGQENKVRELRRIRAALGQDAH